MDEFTALAQHVAVGAGDVRGCLIVSRDGLILGEFPAGDEAVTKPAWLRFAALGEPQKGFVEFPDQLWAYVHRGAYAAFAVAEPSVRPGLLMDRLEQALLTAEEARTRREPLRIAEGTAPSGKPRTPLHPAAAEPAEPRTPAPDPVSVAGVAPAAEASDTTVSAPAEASATAASAPVEAGSAGGEDGAVAPSGADAPPVVLEGTPEAAGADPEPTPADRAIEPAAGGPAATREGASTDRRPAARPTGGDEPEETEVDRVLLAKEFSGLLQMDEDVDDAGS